MVANPMNANVALWMCKLASLLVDLIVLTAWSPISKLT